MYWFLGILGIVAVLWLRRGFSPRARVCKYVIAAQDALERRDFQSFGQNLERSRQMAEELRDEALRLEFRGDLALFAVQGAYCSGDIAGAERAASRAIELLGSIDPADRKGKLCSAHIFLGDIHLDSDQPARAEEEFRSAARLAEASSVPVAAIFPLQKLADALLEQEKRSDAETVIQRCVEIEKGFFAGKKQASPISMVAPDLSFVRADFAAAEKLFEEKVRYFESSADNSSGIDVLRYQLHLAEAQLAQSNVENAHATLTSACAATEKQFGPTHPRVLRIRRKLESIQMA